MTSSEIADLFASYSEPDEYEVQVQLELFAWHQADGARDRNRVARAWRRKTQREQLNAYDRARSVMRRDYWRAYKRQQRPASERQRCGACGGAGHNARTCDAEQARAA